MRGNSTLAVCAALMLVFARPHAQAPPSTFQAEVNLIEVDTIVTDEQGHTVVGLIASDFELFDNGDPQKIVALSFVDLALAIPTEFPGVERPVEQDVRTNREPVSGRMYVIVLDDMNIDAMRSSTVRKHAREFVESYFGVGDIAAVTYTSGRVDASQDFTSDPQLLLASIDKFMGRGARSSAMEAAAKYYEDRLTLTIDPPDGVKPENIPQMAADMQDARMRTLGQGGKPTVDITDFDRAQRVITVFDSVRTLTDALAPVRGRRKAVVMFSEGFNYQMTEPFGMRSVSDVIRATQDTLSAAARANVNFYTIDPRALVGAGDDFMQMTGPGIPGGSTLSAITEELQRTRDSLRVLADETGGFATIDANALSSAFDRIVDSNSRYYVLGYTPPDDRQDGRYHKIDVRVKRPGLKVIARHGYATPRAQTLEDRKRDDARRRARDARRPDGDTTSTELRGVLESALQASGVGLSVQAAPFRNREAKGDASVALAIEIDGNRLPLSPPGKLEVSFYSVNDKGRAGAGVRKEIDLALKPDTVARVKSHGIRLNPRMALAPGRYQLRFGARESSGGQSGSVFYDLIVPDFRKEDLAISGLLLTSVAAQQTPTADPDPLASKQLPGAVTSRREFPVGDTLAVYAEVYDNNPSGQPRKIDVAVRVIGAQGTDVFNATDSMSNAAPSNIFAQFTLDDLDPGTYLLRVEAKVSGSATTIGRETLITVVR
ncbi:MAG TPA: VWA domain-containing protein [Vicinamibacterales bacterium]|nr:VWA domain-containing protein [Vicinamibacterales bacterium]